jgi:NAD(P)-dependent dehydrogenase (short-subunit alcohol dehydrogenase family)
MERLKDKVAVITGASSGIGAETARLFAREGASVVLVARRQEALDRMAEEIRSAGGVCLTAAGDVTKQADCENVFKKAVERFGRVDILVNNAGDGDQHMTCAKCTDEMWYRMIELNQSSVLRFCREALKYMERQGSGTIVNLSAIAGVYGNAGVSYSAAKAAVIAMTKNIAVQYAGHGIRCNAVCPGPTLVPRMDGREDNLYDKDFLAITERHMDMSIPFASVEDQANVILFLASDESKAITGQAIVSDNGRCL